MTRQTPRPAVAVAVNIVGPQRIDAFPALLRDEEGRNEAGVGMGWRRAKARADQNAAPVAGRVGPSSASRQARSWFGRRPLRSGGRRRRLASVGERVSKQRACPKCSMLCSDSGLLQRQLVAAAAVGRQYVHAKGFEVQELTLETNVVIAEEFLCKRQACPPCSRI